MNHVVVSGSPVIRILITILAITLSMPSASAASMLQNRDMDWIGPTCCASESDTENEQTEIQSACCCSLSPIHHAGKISDTRSLTSEEIVAPLSAIMMATYLDVDALTRVPSNVTARGPPRETLLSQHTLLQI